MKVMIWVLIFSVALLRLLTLGMPGLIDTSEGRYGAIGQDMLVSGNWLMPYIRLDEGLIPYWGKPPLHFWLTAASLSLFGMNEWAARFPSFLGGALCAVSVFWLTSSLKIKVFSARSHLHSQTFNEIGALAVLILFAMPLFFYLSGAVILDVTLAGMCSMAVAALFIGHREAQPQRAKKLMLIGCVFAALGFLVKGPVAVVLIGMPFLLMALFERSLSFFKAFPWISGITVFLLLVAPWFLIAEHFYPGFLKYFFFSENLQRFLTKDYVDNYGTGHVQPYGMSWLMWMAGIGPWMVVLVAAVHEVVKSRRFARSDKTRQQVYSSEMMFIVCWAISAPLFFTLAKQITGTYFVPALPPVAILISVFLHRAIAQNHYSWIERSVYRITAALGGVLLCLAIWEWRIEGLFYPALLTSLMGVILLALFFLRDRAIAKVREPAIHFGILALALVGLYIAVIFIAKNQLDDRRTTKRIIEAIGQVSDGNRGTPLDKRASVGILFGNPFSAYFYGQVQGLTVKHITTQEADEGLVDNIIVKSRDLEKLPSTVLQNYPLKITRGRWNWLSKSAGLPTIVAPMH